MKIYLIAGEASGDAHGAVLMREIAKLSPEVEFSGAGGPQMRAIAGDHFVAWTHEAVLGLWDVLVKYPYFRKQFYRMYREICSLLPDAVIFVDYPGFNLRLASYLRRKNFNGKLIYYISPQVWAWNRNRVSRMAKFLDLMICIFPFEKQLYEASGLRTEFIGHPIVEELEARRVAQVRDPELIALLPGSRRREVRRILPPMLEAALLLRQRNPKIRFEASAASSESAESIRRTAARSGLHDLPVGVENSTELMQRASVGMVASGTATLESSFFRLPFVLIYKVSWATYFPARLLIRVNSLGIPNILAGRGFIPEFIQHKAAPERIAEAVWNLYREPAARAKMIREMDRVIHLLGEKGAGQRAAEVVVRELAMPKDLKIN